MSALLIRYRLSLGLFIVGLILSGLTAFPLLTELRLLASLLGIESPARYADYHGLQHWIAYVLFGLEQTYAKFPFIGYGTDWLAFGHLAIAVFFIRPFWRPLESDWVLKCGLVCCAGIFPLALIARPSPRHPALLAADRLLLRRAGRAAVALLPATNAADARNLKATRNRPLGFLRAQRPVPEAVRTRLGLSGCRHRGIHFE